MANKGPKTARGQRRKLMTGDGRRSPETPMKEFKKSHQEAMNEIIHGKKKKR